MEELKWDKDGKFLIESENYEVPGTREVPNDFRVTLLPNSKNSCNVASSKPCGESPHSMSISVVLALKNAIAASRKEHGLEEWFQIILPLTRERVRMACGDVIKLNQSEL
eukprot:TRINITY_DN3563_c0_g2_i1.p1 TRINITY_DN3563_c0_g2~~TRINITY_DN3563_c0_g2_i1.p1  ORF type:complete len:110 (+),score=10.05 TRINITY_DN3563_c0_g2_i1:528-857(+)